ncbi:hypothetical protein ACWDUI_21910 [Streptosporangium sandarakinum]|uniref:hypothetical protein n=1 Tax=Streptosporangium sandarakinum TaxID=1260955 RepID=UPI0037AB1638
MTEESAPGADDVLWVTGCGMLAVVALASATFGTFLDIFLVARAQNHCLGDLGTGERFAGFIWATGRLVVFPVVAAGSALASAPIGLIARLPWLARYGWPKAVLATVAVLAAAAGPTAMILYDVATEGAPGDCVPPWWPSWLPFQAGSGKIVSVSVEGASWW